MMEKPMPEAPQAPAQEAQEGPNPVVDALNTVAQFVAAQVEKGAPNANALQDWLQKGLSLLTGGGQAPENAPMPEEAPAGGPKEMTRDINAGAGATKVL